MKDFINYFYDPKRNKGIENRIKNSENIHINPLLFNVTRAGCGILYNHPDFFIERNNEFSFYTVQIVTNGSMFLVMDGKEYILNKNDGFIILPHQKHKYGILTKEKLALTWIEFTGPLCKELLSSVKAKNLHTFHQTSENNLNIDDVLSYLKYSKVINPYILSAKIYTFIMDFLNMSDNIQGKPSNPLLSDAIDYITEHINENIYSSEIAEFLHISTAYLNKIFNEHTGMSTTCYIKQKHIEHACSLLITTSLSCEEISEKTGFCNSAYFNKVFKEVLGKTPENYRNDYK